VLGELNRLHIAATRLYYARRTAPDGEAELLENLRVALGLPAELGFAYPEEATRLRADLERLKAENEALRAENQELNWRAGGEERLFES